MTKLKQHTTAAAIGIALIASFGFAPAAHADPSDYSPAAIEDASGTGPSGAAEIDDASGPRDTVTDDNPHGAGVAAQSGSGPRKVGAEIQSGSGPRPVGKPVGAI